MNPKGIHNMMTTRQIVSKPSLISSHYSICLTIPEVYSRVCDRLRLVVIDFVSKTFVIKLRLELRIMDPPLFVLLKSAENNLIMPNTTFE